MRLAAQLDNCVIGQLFKLSAPYRPGVVRTGYLRHPYMALSYLSLPYLPGVRWRGIGYFAGIQKFGKYCVRNTGPARKDRTG